MCVRGCAQLSPPLAPLWKGGRDIWGPGLHHSRFNYRFSATGRWAHIGKEGGAAPKPCHFPASEGFFKGGHLDIFSASRRVDCRGPSMNIMTDAFCSKLGVNGSNRLVSCQTSHYFFFFCHLLTVWVSCVSLFFLFLPLPGKMARYLRDPSRDDPLPCPFRHRGLHHGPGSAQNQTRPGLEIRRAGVHGCVDPEADPPLP